MSSMFNYSGLRSPPRGPISKPSPTSPFCTSPSQLQEVTLDPDVSLAYSSVGLRSPGGPMRGRSVKEFEEQLTNLRKENFNLKLRIYFLEERMGKNFNVDQESAVKKNIELMVELESAKKELQEKQELLCQAVKAMELEEEEHRKDADFKETQYCEIKRQYEILQQQYEDEIRSQGDNTSVDNNRERELYCQAFNLNDNSSEDVIKELEIKITDLQAQLRDEKDTVAKLNGLLKYTEMRSDTADLQLALHEKDSKLHDMELELVEKNVELSETSTKLNIAEDTLSEKKNELDYMEKELSNRNVEINELLNEIDEMRKMVESTKELLKQEQKKSEKNKVAITNRNSKISEMESDMEKYRKRIRGLETRLETAQNEVKGKTEELESYYRRSPLKSTIHSDVDSFLVRSTATAADHTSKSLSRLTPSPTKQQHHKKLTNSSKSKSSTSPTAVSAPELDLEAIEQDFSKAMVPHEEGSEAGAPHNREVLKLVQDLKESKKAVWNLEANQLKACRLIQAMLDSRKKHTKEIEELTQDLQRRDEQISELRSQMGAFNGTVGKTSIKDKISELNLTAAAPPSDVEHTMGDGVDDPTELIEQYKALTQQLDTQRQILENTLTEKNAQLEELQEKYNQLQKDTKSRDTAICSMQLEMFNKEVNVSWDKPSDMSSSEKVSYWVQESADKDKEIERLEGELKKRTCDLQGIVNNELWGKNREIEKLEKRYTELIENKEAEIFALHKDISNKDTQLRVLKETIDEIGTVASLRHVSNGNSLEMSVSDEDLQNKIISLLAEREQHAAHIQAIKDQYNETFQLRELREQLRKSEQLRGECNEVCNILSTRLEELAQFLDSLLNKKSILGFLGQKQGTRLRNIVDQSLDLSRSLCMSITMNPDQSLLQLTNISNLLNTTRQERLNLSEIFPNDEENNCILSIVPDNVTLTYESHLHLKGSPENDKVAAQSHIIAVLRSQVENLKREIEIRDVELGNKLSVQNDNDFVNAIVDIECKPQRILSPDNILENLCDDNKESKLNTTSTMKYMEQSDSESWSEPDLNVSKARIGLKSPHYTRSARKQILGSTESTECELDRPLLRTPPKKSLDNRQTIIFLNQQISELENNLKEKDNQLLKAESAYFEVDNKYKEEQLKFQAGKAAREKLQQQIIQTEQKLCNAEKKKVDAEQQVEHLQNTIHELEANKIYLLESMDAKSKSFQNLINQLEVDRSEAIESAKKAENALEGAQNEIYLAEQKLSTMHKEMLLSDTNNRLEAAERLQRTENEFELKLRTIELKTDAQIKKLAQSASQLQAKYDAEYVKRSEMDRLTKKLKELESMETFLKITEDKVYCLEESEATLKHKLIEIEKDHRNAVNELRRELDQANLQYSEAYLQKTQIENEKIMLEQEMQRFKDKEAEFVRQVNDLKQDFSQMHDSFQKQITNLGAQKYKLEMKITELESMNVELRNKMIAAQTGRNGDQTLSAPGSPPSKILELYLSKNQTFGRQMSDMSGYNSNSEDQISLGNGINNKTGFRFNEQNVDNERHHGNSSPDLGIESDHGRFSSLEANTIHRPFLQTLEISASMNNMLNKDQSLLCTSDHCCSKSKELLNENECLRKKLHKSRKILEETSAQLSAANHRKREVEKTICKEISKTSEVLRKAKDNLGSGSEQVFLKK